ncbi:MAG: hypothetical protein ACK50E_05680 [Bacteroidota bacterium]
MIKSLQIFYILILSFFAAEGQNKISFNNKKINELGVNMGMMYGIEEFRPTFPLIWKDFNPDSDDYSFSGYYTLDTYSNNENKTLNGEVKLIRVQIQVAEGTLNIKEELTFNFKNGDMNGRVIYSQYSSDNNGETSEADLKHVKWKKDVSISANYDYADGNYKGINFFEIRDWEKTKYTISQSVGYDISLDYFNTIININTSSPTEKPIFKKVKY